MTFKSGIHERIQAGTQTQSFTMNLTYQTSALLVLNSTSPNLHFEDNM